jgi:hypothetical protein
MNVSRLRRLRACAIAGLLFPAAAGASSPPPAEAIAIDRFTEGVTVDGVLDEAGWKTAARVELSYEIEPRRNTPARAATVCRLGYDARHLYFACDATDPDPSAIRAYYADRDRAAGHDQVGLALDTAADARRAFVFGVTALGVQSDSIFDQERMQDNAQWDAIWASAGRLTPTGFVVEAAIPLRTLRYSSSAAPQSWRFYFWRTRPRSAVQQTRSVRLEPGSTCALCAAAPLAGLSGLTEAGAVDLTPTVTAHRTDRRADPSTRIESGAVVAEPGVTARWALASDMSLGVTLNPDFSQIEADAVQLDVNNRFALTYPEKRPFFLEGAELFEMPMASVYTRTIADPRAGVKLTGRMGRTSIGVLAARDEVTNVLIPRLEGSRIVSSSRPSTTGIARVRHDLSRRLAVGALYTIRQASGYDNHVASVDAVFRPTGALTVTAQFQGSQTDERVPDASASGRGAAGYLAATYQTRTWNVDASYTRIDPAFRADAGMIGQVGYRERRITARRTFWSTGQRWLTNVAVAAAHWPLDDPNGQLHERWQFVALDYRGPRQSRAAFYARRRTERYLGVLYDFYTPFYGLEVEPVPRLSLVLNMVMGKAIAYESATLADSSDISPRLVFQAGRHVRIEARHTRQRLSEHGHPLLAADLSEARLVFNLNARTFLRATLLHQRAAQRDAARHAWRQSASFTPQYLFSYKINPETVIFAGYNEAFEEDAPVRRSLTRTSRSFFMKLGYAFRL